MRADIPLADLLLDTMNPRLEVQEAHREAVREHFRVDATKMFALINDIVEQGQLSPLEKIGASPSVDHPGRYIVREGNRRVASLIALNNPEIVKGVLSPSDEKRLTKLSAEFRAKNLPSTVEAEVLPAENLMHWIELRHTGENKGVGIVGWGTEEQDRFKMRQGAQKPLDLQLLDRYRAHVKGDAVEEKMVRDVPKTTLRRAYAASVAGGTLTLHFASASSEIACMRV